MADGERGGVKQHWRGSQTSAVGENGMKITTFH